MTRLFVDSFRAAVWASEDLTTAERLLLLAMAEFCTWETGGDCRPGATTLGRMMRKDPRTVKSLRRGLEGRWLYVMERGGQMKGGKRATTYQLAIPDRGSDTPSPVVHMGSDAPSDRGCDAPSDLSTWGISSPTGGVSCTDRGRDTTQPPNHHDHRAGITQARQISQTIRAEREAS